MPTDSTNDHDNLAYRLTQILSRLNQGEKLAPAELAAEFNVHQRTIQRDLKERFAFLPLEKAQGHYHLHPSALGKLSLRDIDNFAGLAGVHGLFPSLSSEFLRDVFDSRVQSPLLVKGHHYEDLRGKESMFGQIETAITQHACIAFDYLKHEGSKSYAQIQPYKLINHGGIWYLAGKDGEVYAHQWIARATGYGGRGGPHHIAAHLCLARAKQPNQRPESVWSPREAQRR